MLLSPTVACLYKPYNSNSSLSVGLVGKLETASACKSEKMLGPGVSIQIPNSDNENKKSFSIHTF